MSSAAAQQKSPERGVSSIVREAVRQAHKSSPSKQVPTPTGLVVKTTFEHREDTIARALKSPTLSEMDQLLAPTYESGSFRGSHVSSASVNASEDIIRKVELEIETARKAATEAHARLAVASGTFDGLDTLDDNDFMRDILSVSSVEESTGGDENKPKEDIEAEGPVAKVIRRNQQLEDQTEPADSASNGSPVSDGIPDVPTQRTFESGVELALEDTIAALHTITGVTSLDLDFSETGMTSNDINDIGTTSNDLTQDGNESDDDSDYTEETVTDHENSIVTDDETSEYTEESATDDGEPTDDNSEYTEETGHTGDHVPGEQLSSVSGDAVEEKKEKPWFAGTRGWFGGGEEPRPVTPRGFIGSPQSTPKSPASTVDVSNGHGKYAKVLRVSPFQAERTETEMITQSPEDGVSEKSKKNSNLWLLDPKVDSNESMAPVCENAKPPTPPASNVGLDTTATNSEEPAPRDVNIITGEADPAEKSDTQDKYSASQVQFRYPYPVPPKVPKPRPASEIIKHYSLGTPERVARWVQPKPELEELLLAVKGDSMPRRSNACGALKVLLARNPKNLLALVRTVGFLEALVFACSEDVVSSPEMETALIARTRAATTIMKVSEPKENRVLVMMEPGLSECLVKVIMEDTGEARAHACAALAMLAKTPANRQPIVDVKDLVNVLAQVVSGAIDPTLGPVVREEKKEDPQGPFGFGSSSLNSAGEDSGDGIEAMSTGASSTASPPVSTVNFRADSIRKHKDGKQEEYTMQSKHHACATLMHLSKHCPNSVSPPPPHTHTQLHLFGSFPFCVANSIHITSVFYRKSYARI
jgi:hypothetical protein